MKGHPQLAWPFLLYGTPKGNPGGMLGPGGGGEVGELEFWAQEKHIHPSPPRSPQHPRLPGMEITRGAITLSGRCQRVFILIHSLRPFTFFKKKTKCNYLTVSRGCTLGLFLLSTQLRSRL